MNYLNTAVSFYLQVGADELSRIAQHSGSEESRLKAAELLLTLVYNAADDTNHGRLISGLLEASFSPPESEQE